MKLINRKLANSRILKFCKFLEVEYPTSQPVTVKFQTEAFIYFNNTPIVCGMCDKTTLLIAIAHDDTHKLLRTIAHEYRHALQWLAGGNREGLVITLSSGMRIRSNPAEEVDAERFADEAVAAFTGSPPPSATSRPSSASRLKPTTASRQHSATPLPAFWR